jgi:hypothetical protein
MTDVRGLFFASTLVIESSERLRESEQRLGRIARAECRLPDTIDAETARVVVQVLEHQPSHDLVTSRRAMKWTACMVASFSWRFSWSGLEKSSAAADASASLLILAPW